MTTTFHVRVWCEDTSEYKRTTQIDSIDDSWKPAECAAHTVRDFTIEYYEVTA